MKNIETENIKGLIYSLKKINNDMFSFFDSSKIFIYDKSEILDFSKFENLKARKTIEHVTNIIEKTKNSLNNIESNFYNVQMILNIMEENQKFLINKSNNKNITKSEFVNNIEEITKSAIKLDYIKERKELLGYLKRTKLEFEDMRYFSKNLNSIYHISYGQLNDYIKLENNFATEDLKNELKKLAIIEELSSKFNNDINNILFKLKEFSVLITKEYFIS